MQTATEITIEKIGRRYYFRGDTYAHKGLIRAQGAKWDPDRRGWWTGKGETAEAVLAAVSDAPPAPKTLRGAPTMLPGGEWGVRVFAACVGVGDAVKVVTKSGKSWETTVSRIVRVDSDTTIVETPARSTTRPRRPSGESEGEYCGGRCPVRGHRCCAANGPCHDCE
jgi:hypothetical protein